MSWIDRTRAAWRALRKRPEVEHELQEELRFHLEMQAAANRAAGMEPEAARAAALRAFGGVERVKEECRDAWGARQLETLGQDVRYGARGLWRERGYAAAVLLTLALGIGATTAIFSVVHGVLLRPLPYPRPSELVVLSQPAPAAGIADAGFSIPDLAELRQRSRALAGVVEYHSMHFNLLGRAEPERVQTGVVSANYFEVLGVRPLIGRGFEPADEAPGSEPVLVLSHGYWLRSHGGDAGVVGRVFEMNDKPHRVVGVLPAVAQYPPGDDVYMTTAACPFRGALNQAEGIQARTARGYVAFARLRRGVSYAAAAADLDGVQAALRADYPEAYPAAAGFDLELQPLQAALTRSARRPLLLLLSTAGLVMLIVCANVANLNLARLVRREGELAVRLALGAGKGRLARQLLTESALLALCGGVLGLVVAGGGLRLLMAFAARFTPRAEEIGIDLAVLAFLLGVSLATGVLSGLLPFLSARLDLAAAVKESGQRSGESHGRQRLRRLLVVAQVALSCVLLVGAGLALRTLWSLQGVHPGFDPQSVLAVQIDLDWSRYTGVAERDAFWRDVLGRLSEHPQVAVAAAAATFPLNADQGPARLGLAIEGRAPGADEVQPLGEVRFASPGYFRAVGMPVLRGRGIEEVDRLEAEPVAVVSESMARRFWPGEDPLGRRFSFNDGQNWRTIVGVVGDVRQDGLASEIRDQVYLSISQTNGFSGSLLLRTAGSPRRLLRAVRQAVHAVDPRQPLGRVQTLQEARHASLAPSRLTASLLAMFAVLALAVTSTGLGGLLAYSVGLRRQEIGVRLALGAQPRGVMAMVVGQGMRLALLGLGFGILGGLALGRAMSGLLYGVGSADPGTLAIVALVLLGVAAVSSLLPARQATAISAVQALRGV